MNYPLISEYIEAVKTPEDNFDQLRNLRPVLDDIGEPVMSSGNFAVVFKMKDVQTGKLHALKCFLRDQERRAEAYRQIAEELEYVNSPFLTPIKYLDKELFVDTNNSEDNEFPVLLMDWVEGVTLDKYIREHIDDQYELSMLAYQFSRLAMWLMPQPFAHGDLKPDNILVMNDGTLVLVDYDGMYVPAMKGQKARELGSPDFRHPNRTESDFDEHIDDFSLVSILLSLKAISLLPRLLEVYGASDRLLFSEKDYRNLSESRIMNALKLLIKDEELDNLYSLFQDTVIHKRISLSSLDISDLVSKPEGISVGIHPVESFKKGKPIQNDYYTVEKYGKFGVYKMSEGKLIIECIYDEIQYRGGNVVFINKDNLWGVHSFEVSVSSFTGDLFEVNIPCKYLEIEFVNEEDNEYYSVKTSRELLGEKSDSYSIVDYKDERISFSYFDSFSTHLKLIDFNHILTCRRNKYGCVSLLGYESIPFKYDEITNRDDGHYNIRIGNTWGVLKLNGAELVPVRYKDPISERIENSIVIDSLSHKKGVLNADGTEKIPCIYDHIKPLVSSEYPEGELYAIGLGGYEDREYRIIEKAYWQIVYKNNRIIVGNKYDVFKTIDEFILCGRDGSFYKWSYYGKYDLYNINGDLLIGGFTTFIYEKEHHLMLFQFGEEYNVDYGIYYTEYSSHPYERLVRDDKKCRWLVLDKDLNSIIKNKDGRKYTFRKGFVCEIETITKNGKTINYWNVPLELTSKYKPIIKGNHLICGDSANKVDVVIDKHNI